MIYEHLPEFVFAKYIYRDDDHITISSKTRLLQLDLGHTNTPALRHHVIGRVSYL